MVVIEKLKGLFVMQNSRDGAKIIFAGVGRDCARYLPSVLRGVDQISSKFSESAFVFIENDSKDSTKSILQSWGSNKQNFNLINLDGLARIPQRGLRLEVARNTYLEFIRGHSFLSGYDYLVVLDMDDVNTRGVCPEKFKDALDFLASEPQNAAVFSNQEGTYYDMWTLRHKDLCPGDLWEDVLSYVHKHKVSDQEAFNNTFAKRIISLEQTGEMLEVESAFGGFGAYKLNYALRNQHSYLGSKVKVLPEDNSQVIVYRQEVCEHVHFNMGIRNLGGRLFIKTDMINASNTGMQFSASFFRQIIF
ncbi:glycosyltransferase family A protein [Polynucleobacter sp. AP-Feld-500C-C5]|uniref:glycosyltransferase family A protein n=1 Tax=Polynucleobacter sp. AP-Feld-500C-C5 TaxID=2576924 RepID=UPI001C0E6B39|nr:glycosyltransferase family A protein [Polynucleobacter sp. AP-Feld-500C-C5]MBU3632673.1 glycosyltransferase family 2 protein [Polynucleobacter sp. AP-Feld-500C-C5]